MHLFLLGLSHHTAPVELREQLDFKGDLVPALMALSARPALDEAVVLSTCNRAEVYAACSDVSLARPQITDFFSRFHEVPVETLAPHLYERTDREAASHLFRVAAGLDSLVIGEPQILGQVKDAYSVASQEKSTSALLNKLFHSSFVVGKRVRSETGLGEGAVSVSYAAVSLARKIFGDLRHLNVLLVGAGEMAKLTAIHLRGQQVHQVRVTSRTTAHAETLAAQVHGTAIPWHELQLALHESDIVITATGSPTPILSRAAVEQAMRKGRSRALFIIDIALPRDVDPAVGDLEQVFLYNIDDLQAIVSENLARRSGQIEQAEHIVAEEADRYMGWLRSRQAVPTVVALRQRFEAIRLAELERLEPKLAALSPEARARVEEITRLINEKLLLTPTEQLKALSDEESVVACSEALSRLFSLTGEQPDERLVSVRTRRPRPPVPGEPTRS